MQKRLLIYALLFVMLLTACEDKIATRHFLKGIYDAMQLYSNNQILVFTSSDKYNIHFGDDGKVSVKGEDNILSAQYLIITDSMLLSNLAMTDVCCNTDTANRLFHFFDAALHWQQKGDTLMLHSASGKLQLVHRKN
jgi:heat shock protein HslJ